MITRRMRLRRRLLDTYVRLELEARAVPLDERHPRSQERPLRSRPMVKRSTPMMVTKPETTHRRDGDVRGRFAAWLGRR